jgi:hypothetical protein
VIEEEKKRITEKSLNLVIEEEKKRITEKSLSNVVKRSLASCVVCVLILSLNSDRGNKLPSYFLVQITTTTPPAGCPALS